MAAAFIRSPILVSSLLFTSIAPLSHAGQGRSDRETPRQESKEYRLDAGDILGVYIEGILGNAKDGLPVFVAVDQSLSPLCGFPVRIWGDGTISLPGVRPVAVQGKTVSEVERLLRGLCAGTQENPPAKGSEVVVTLMRERAANEPREYRVKAGDVLGIFVGGLVGNFDADPPVHLNARGRLLPSVGYPIHVEDSGRIQLPMIEPIAVSGETLQEIETKIRKVYSVDNKFLYPEKCRIMVSLMWTAAEEHPPAQPYRLRPGDTVALAQWIFDERQFSDRLVYLPDVGESAPFWGFPFCVAATGELYLPRVPRVKVAGLTIPEALHAIRREDSVETTILRGERFPFVLSLVRRQSPGTVPRTEDKLSCGDLLCVARLPLPEKEETRGKFYVPDDPTLSPCFGELVPVLPDETVLLPSIGRVQASGKSAQELQRDIEAEYVRQRILQPGREWIIVQLARKAAR